MGSEMCIRDRHRDLLIEREPDQERERVAREERVRVGIAGEVDRVGRGHASIVLGPRPQPDAPASRSATRSATAAVARFVLTRGTSGMTEASAT